MSMIEPRSETIKNLFLSASFSVPDYQRAYEWGSEEVGEFWTDLNEYVGDKDDGYFLGTVIFERRTRSSGMVEIVEGQQRLTTMFIFLIACRNRAFEIGTEHSITMASHAQLLINDVDFARVNESTSRLKPSSSIRAVFTNMAKLSWRGAFDEKIDGKGVGRQNNRIRPVYNFFKEKLAGLDVDELSGLLEALYRSYVVRIDIHSEEEAFKIFERNNARGIDLEASDLLKNFFFKQLRNDETANLNELWDKTIANASNTFPRMLKYFYVSQRGYIKKSDLYRALTKYNPDPKVLLDDLLAFSEFYKTIRNSDDPDAFRKYAEEVGLGKVASDQDKISKISFALEGLRLFKITQVYPLIFSAIACYKKTPIPESNNGPSKLMNQFVSFFQRLENYHFINNAICTNIGNEVEKLYADYSKKFSESTDFIAIADGFFDELKKKLVAEDTFINRFKEVNYVSNLALIPYIFDRFYNFNYDQGQPVSSGARLRIFNPSMKLSRRNHNIEHWYPRSSQNPNNLTDDEINNIGNLLILTFKANSTLGNILPVEKLAKLSGVLSPEIQNTTFVKRFLSEYSDRFDDWSSDVIDERATELATDSYRKIWRFN
jgi:hypothetical protein